MIVSNRPKTLYTSYFNVSEYLVEALFTEMSTPTLFLVFGVSLLFGITDRYNIIGIVKILSSEDVIVIQCLNNQFGLCW